jgi:Putative DNA-binding domain
VISIERVRQLIELGNENRNLDYKGAFSWDEASKDQKCEITKDILAFSNVRDGGVILVGVNDKTGVVEGLTEQQYASFDQTKLNDFVHRYTDPRHTSLVHRLTIEGKRVVVIDVPEFADVPILCARDVNSSTNSSRLILKRATLYKRTDKATSEPIEESHEMRELLNRGLFRRQDELLRAFKQITQPSDIDLTQEPGVQFRSEIEDAERYFSELDGEPFAQSPHWTVQMRPETFIADRVRTFMALQRLVQESAISLRGWTFPIAGRVSGSPWINFESGSQSSHNGHGDRPEAIRVNKSGLVIWRAGLAEDYWQGLAGRNVISFIGVIFAVTEWVLFARRFFESVLSVDETVRLTVRAVGLKGRVLVSAYPGIDLHGSYRTELASFEITEIVMVSDLRADPEGVARRMIRRVFELFNWNDPDETMLQNWQQKLIQRQF